LQCRDKSPASIGKGALDRSYAAFGGQSLPGLDNIVWEGLRIAPCRLTLTTPRAGFVIRRLDGLPRWAPTAASRFIVARRLADKYLTLWDSLGGWGGIRTHERLAPLPVFKTGALNRSATHPLSALLTPRAHERLGMQPLLRRRRLPQPLDKVEHLAGNCHREGGAPLDRPADHMTHRCCHGASSGTTAGKPFLASRAAWLRTWAGQFPIISWKRASLPAKSARIASSYPGSFPAMAEAKR
jgi:hypothetical protein